MAIVLLVLICLLTMCSGYRKGPDEDDGFWEVYNLYWRSHLMITMIILTIMLLWIPAITAFVRVMLNTMEDVSFFRDELPKLEGCVDAYNVKEAIDKASGQTFDQLVMHFIQVGCHGLFVLFGLLHLFSAWCRRCVEKSQAKREYSTQLARLKANEVVDATNTDDMDQTKRSSRGSDRSFKQKRIKLDFHNVKPMVELSSEFEEPSARIKLAKKPMKKRDKSDEDSSEEDKDKGEGDDSHQF